MFKALGRDITGSHRTRASVRHRLSLALEEMPKQQLLEITVFTEVQQILHARRVDVINNHPSRSEKHM